MAPVDLQLLPNRNSYQQFPKQQKYHWRRFFGLSGLLYKISADYFTNLQIMFSNDGLHIILNLGNLEIWEHSSFFNYWRNCRLNQTWKKLECSPISKFLRYEFRNLGAFEFFSKVDLNDNFANNWKNSNALKLINP